MSPGKILNCLSGAENFYYEHFSIEKREFKNRSFRDQEIVQRNEIPLKDQMIQRNFENTLLQIIDEDLTGSHIHTCNRVRNRK